MFNVEFLRAVCKNNMEVYPEAAVSLLNKIRTLYTLAKSLHIIY